MKDIKSKLIISLFFILACLITSCVPKDEVEPEEQVDLNVSIGGSNEKMASFGFGYDTTSGDKHPLVIPFLGGTIVNAFSLEVNIPDYKAGKTIYDATKNEVIVTYEADIDVSGSSSGEWVSQKGTVEITKLDGEIVEGTINVTLKSSKTPNKLLDVKNGSFKVKKF